MSRSKKGPKALRRPALTARDKAIYIGGMLLSFGLMFLSLKLVEWVSDSIFFADPSVLAYSKMDIFSLLFYLYPIFGALLLGIQFDKKTPLFGNPDLRYGVPPWDSECLPLWDKKYKSARAALKKRFWRRFLPFFFAGYFACAALVPFGVMDRDVLYEGNRMERFNAVNQLVATYTAEDFSHLTVEVEHKFGGFKKVDSYRFSLSVEMKDGEEIVYSYQSFEGRPADGKGEHLDTMLDKAFEWKAMLKDGAVTLEGREDLETVARHIGMNEAQKERLRLLFEE